MVYEGLFPAFQSFLHYMIMVIMTPRHGQIRIPPSSGHKTWKQVILFKIFKITCLCILDRRFFALSSENLTLLLVTNPSHKCIVCVKACLQANKNTITFIEKHIALMMFGILWALWLSDIKKLIQPAAGFTYESEILWLPKVDQQIIKQRLWTLL